MEINAIRCKVCGDIIWSRHVHDFRYCSCKKVAIDGGREYCRTMGELDNIEFLIGDVDKDGKLSKLRIKKIETESNSS